MAKIYGGNILAFKKLSVFLITVKCLTITNINKEKNNIVHHKNITKMFINHCTFIISVNNAREIIVSQRIHSCLFHDKDARTLPTGDLK